MGIYRTCQRYFPGSHLPHLYIGMEYLRINNLPTAALSFQKSLDINPKDPIIYNEMGVTCYKRKLYDQAREYFLKAKSLCISSADWILCEILTNLGHSYRKLK